MDAESNGVYEYIQNGHDENQVEIARRISEAIQDGWSNDPNWRTRPVRLLVVAIRKELERLEKYKSQPNDVPNVKG